MTSFSCIVVGEGSIALTCLHHLLESGFKVDAVFTNTPEIQAFCQRMLVKLFPRRTRIEDVITSKSFDHLFSINNPTILSERALSLARKLSINFHDSPLPAYAGVHSTSWAIINGEREHGVSWHVMEPGIDTGDILQSQPLQIDENDSVFTLNMKCLEAATMAFKRLVSDIGTGLLKHNLQNFSKRSYYGLYELPPNLGVLDFSQGLKKTYNLARALEFGAHENRLGTPKICTPSGNFLLVHNVEIRGSFEHLPGPANRNETGSVLHIQDNVLLVSTDSDAISLTVSELDGQHLSSEDFDKMGIKVGTKLTAVDDTVSDAMILLPKKEQFWRQRMKSYEPTTMFIQRFKAFGDALDYDRTDVESVEIPLPKLRISEQYWETDDFLASSFIAFLARTSCTSSVHVGIVARTHDINSSYLPLYAEICPGVFKFNLSASVTDAIDQCVQTLLRHKEAKTFLLDMYFRYPELREIKRTPHHNLVIGFENDHLTEKQKRSILSDSSLLILIGHEKISISFSSGSDRGHSHIRELFQHFPTFLTSLTLNDGSRTLLDVNLLSSMEAEMLYRLPDVTVDDHGNDIMDLFRHVCLSQKKSTAIRTTHAEITYTQLWEEVCSLADLISSNFPQAYRTDLRCIALHMPNSIAYVVSVLSAVMCSNPFMPLPENTPIDRLAFMLRDSRATTMITTKEISMSERFKALVSTQEVLFEVQTSFGHLVMLLLQIHDVDELQNMQKAKGLSEVYSFTNLSDLNEEENNDVSLETDCCYVMYTSGSTGKPKGVHVKFSGVFNMALAQIDQWDICSKDAIAQFASIGFDATISEIFTAVLSGACLAVLEENERLGREFIDAMSRLQVSIITLPPSVLNIYGPDDFPSLKKVVTAGEACTFLTAMRWAEGSSIRFFNAYGPTETTVCATIYEYTPGASDNTPSMELPIGKAIHGVQVYLFDDFMKPVPPGVVGEIFIAGQGLAAGYIGHASKMSKERFIQNPLDCQSKVYKTGDHAIQDKDGCLTYIGRLDDQVKIRGQRIDLNEIEQVLLQHPKVDMAVVVKHQCKTSPDASIAAFVAPSLVFPSELREYLARALPCYMMPTHIKKMNIKDFPLTLNGKIDRRKLEKDPSIVEQSSIAEKSHLSHIQLSMAKLWCCVLQLDESLAYNMHKLSTFSEFGGNSLHMVLLQRVIEEEFNVLPSFTEIGGASSIEDFADLIKHKEMSSTTQLKDVQLKNKSKLDFMNDSILNMQRLADFVDYQTEVRRSVDPSNILLSGSTGFLGAFLLYEILKQSDARVFCMVRETTELKGYSRIVANMKKYKLWKTGFDSRIEVVISDISKPNLGIASNTYKSLSINMDVIFMNAAKMNFNSDYNDHKKANVDGTYEFIKLAMTSRKKFLFTTSSLAVFLFPPQAPSQQQDILASHHCPKSSTLTKIGRMQDIESNDNSEGKGGEINESVANNKKINLNGYKSVPQSHILKLKQKEITNLLIESNQKQEFKERAFILDTVNANKPLDVSGEKESLQNGRLNGMNLQDSTQDIFCPSQVKTNRNVSDSIRVKTGAAKIRAVYGEADEIGDPSHLIGGYGQSKWVSEKLVFQALDHLPGGAIFRPARVSGHSQTGIGPTNDLFACLLKGIQQLGCAPDVSFPYDLTPVDYCAGGMVEIMLQICRGENGKMPDVYHFFNKSTIPFLELFEGTSVDRVPLEEWRERVKKAERENPLVPLTPFIMSSFWDRSPDWPVFSTQNTDRFVSSDCKKRLLHAKSLLKVYKIFFEEKPF